MSLITNHISFMTSVSFTGSGKKKNKSSFSIRKTMNEASYLIRLSHAKTPAQVSAVIALAKADAKSIRKSSDSSSEIRAAQKIAKSVENRGGLKSSRLRSESRLSQQTQTETVADQLKRAKEDAIKLSRKRRNRKMQERAAIANSTPLTNPNEKHIDTYIDDCSTLSCPPSSATGTAISSGSSAGIVDCMI